MRRIIPLLLVPFCVSAFGQSPTSSVVFFEGTWEELLIKAKLENKPFFVDVYATWCGPCKVMQKTTFENAQVGSYANRYYISYKLNAEKGKGPALSHRFRVGAYPTVLFFSAAGELLGRSVGLLPPDDFLQHLEAYREKALRRSDASGGLTPASAAEKAKLGRLFEAPKTGN